MKTYDTFTPNILEMEGKIERKPFNFLADNCKIWHGSCIADWNSTFKVDAIINSTNRKVEVNLDNSELSKYIANYFTFSEISLNQDRVLWSNNLLNGCAGAGKYEPTNMSLFYYSGVLSRIYLNVITPSAVMLELTSNNVGKISDVENPVKKFIENILKNIQADISDVEFISNSHQRYENGIPVRGLQHCGRGIKIKKDINGCGGYMVTVLDLNGNPMWGGNILMTKSMEIVSQSSDKIVLRDYSVKAMSPFGWTNSQGGDYDGLSVFLEHGEINKCVLHMHDKNINIEYYN